MSCTLRLGIISWFLAICPVAPAQRLTTGPAAEAFFNAINENDTPTASTLLAADPNLVRATYYGRLPLHVAASLGNASLVRELLEKGADINAASDTLDTVNLGITALAAAIWYDNPDVCLLLLETGADPNGS